MSHMRDEHSINHDVRMIRFYVDRLTVHKEDGGTFTSDQLQDTEQLADELGGLSEPAPDDEGPRAAGINPPNP